MNVRSLYKLLDDHYDKIADNFASKLTSFKDGILSFLRRVVRYRRVAATHILVVMISPEERNSKPYALTIQCIAYKGIKDSEVRSICNHVVTEMHARKMKVAGIRHYMYVLKLYYIIGFTTNGEWNSLRSKGNNRPLSIFEVRSKARKRYAKLSEKTMVAMLTPKSKEQKT